MTLVAFKGQLISKCLFWRHRFDKKNHENIVRISALKVFIASLGLPGSFLELPVGFLINDITYLLKVALSQKRLENFFIATIGISNHYLEQKI